MILYVDETENEEYFIVTGLLVDSKESTDLAYKRFKKKIKGFKLTNKAKGKIYVEFKSTILDNDFQRIKEKMISEICGLDSCSVLYSYYEKEAGAFSQKVKESVYIELLSKILAHLEDATYVIFDGFKLPLFETKIIEAGMQIGNVDDIVPGDSQLEYGLQFVDNICSIIRLHLANDPKDMFYKNIEKYILQV